jgi:dipeptidyl-peptidase 4
VKLFARLLLVFWIVSACCLAQSATSDSQKTLTIESIFAEGGITGRAPETLQWSPDNSKVSYVQRDDSGEHGELWYVDPATGERHLLVSESKLASLSPPASSIKDEREKERVTRYHVAAYLWSPDSKNLLFDSQGQLWLYSLDSGVAIQFTTNPEPNLDPKFSPDGRNLAYVRKHNLYVRPIKGEDEKQLTRSDKDEKDKDDNLLNGEVDWVYAEELGVRSNYFWSPDGKDIAFLQMDESQVPTYPITDWLPTHPKADAQKYPKAGDHNPSVRLGVVSASGGKTKWISLTDNPDVYIPRFGWVRDGMIWAEVLNRTQDTLDVYFVDTRSGKSHKALSETAPDAWVNVNDDVKFLKASARFTWSSWRDGNTHLYLYSYDSQNPLGPDAKLERQLTQGNFQVLGLQAIDESAGTVYFICNKDDPRQQQLYSVKLDGSDFKRVSASDGAHSAAFSDDAKHYVDTFSASMTPPAMAVCSSGGACQKFWESRSVDEFGLTAARQIEFKADDGTTLYGKILLPPDGANLGKIPLVVNVYGGPAAQLVLNEWGGTTSLFHQILAKQGYAIFSVDNRGTPARNRKFQTAIRHQFGALELKDQLTALDQLFAQYPQLDRSRVAIWGWSNGGAMTLYSLEHSDLFKAGVAVAPVTDWHNYDSTYTERYMGLPRDNVSGYEESSMPKAADKLHGALLLAHGTSDDNVHFQNSIQMVEGLIKAGKQFRFMPYPNKTHGIAGPVDRNHLFHMIQDFFDRELK